MTVDIRGPRLIGGTLCAFLLLIVAGCGERRVGTQPEPAESFEFPTPGTQATALLELVPTFESMSLYWSPADGRAAREALVRYRTVGQTNWRQGLSLWFDDRTSHVPVDRRNEYRGSLVNLRPGTEYEVEVYLDNVGVVARQKLTTWSETFPISRTIQQPRSSNQTLVIDESGASSGYRLYTASLGGSVIDVDGNEDVNVLINASYVIVRGLTLKGARQHAILLGPDSHHVVIEQNNISGWGRIDSDGFGLKDAAVTTNKPGTHLDMTHIVIQRNRIHHPRADSNNWEEYRPKHDTSHPKGPQAIALYNPGRQHVYRYNSIYSDADKMFGDCIGAGNNFDFHRGSPGPDTDIYGNSISHCWDDAIETEGRNRNVRVWGNYIDRTFVVFGLSPTTVGPLYIFRNVTYRHESAPFKNNGRAFKAQSRIRDDVFFGGGRNYLFHNTTYRTSPEAGVRVGITDSGGVLANIWTRNNILDNVRGVVGGDAGPGNNFDYDLYQGEMQIPFGDESHGIEARPHYDPNSAPYALQVHSPGHDDGARIANFNDDFKDAGPDIGAQERGAPALEFGVDAYR